MRFLKSLRAKFLIWFMQTDLYLFVLRNVLPEIKIFHSPGPGRGVKDDFIELMQPGDILVSKTKFALTNLIIGGDFSHGAVVTLSALQLGSGYRIAEMTNRDFDLVSFDEFAKGCTRIALLRLIDNRGNYARKVAAKAMEFKYARYDAQFSLGIEALYCSELCYQSDVESRMKCDLSDLAGLDRPYISPDGIYCAPGLFKVLEWKDSGWSS